MGIIENKKESEIKNEDYLYMMEVIELGELKWPTCNDSHVDN